MLQDAVPSTEWTDVYLEKSSCYNVMNGNFGPNLMFSFVVVHPTMRGPTLGKR